MIKFNMYQKVRTQHLPIIQCIFIFLLFSNMLISATTKQLQFNQKSNSSFINNISFERLNIEDGLSQSSITCIVQDSRGFIWFGTANGLNRYDSNKINVYMNDPNDPSSLSSNGVNLCLLDNQGVLWFITDDNTLNRYDPDTDAFVRIQLLSENINQRENEIRIFLGDSDGNLWFGTMVNGLICYIPETGSLKSYINELDVFGKTQGNRKRVRSIYVGRDNIIWIGTNGGLLSFNKTDQEFSSYPLSFSNSNRLFYKGILTNPLISQIHEDKKGRLWIATFFGGLFQLDRKKEKFIQYPFNSVLPNSFPGNSIRLIHEDHFGMLWLPCVQFKKNMTFEMRCLTRFNPETGAVKCYRQNPANPSSVSQDTVIKIWEDLHNRLWIHTFGGGLDIYDHKTDSFSHFFYDPKEINSLSGNDISCFFEDRAGTIWIGTEYNGACFFDPGWGKFPHYTIDSPVRYRDSNQVMIKIVGSLSEMNESGSYNVIWFSTNAGLNRWDRRENNFRFFEITPKTPNNKAMGICEDKLGNLWLGTQMGLYRGKISDFNNKKERPDFVNIIPRKKLGEGLINEIISDSNGNLWLGIYPVGLVKFNPVTEKILYYKHDPKNPNSLIDNAVTSIFPGRHDTLWIATLSGLDLFDLNQNTFTHIDSNKIEFDTKKIISLYEAPDRNVWLGTWNGLLKYNIETNKVVGYFVENGLPNKVVHAILPEFNKTSGKQFLWLSTENGLSKFDTEIETFENFYRSDGLQSNEFYSRSALLSPNGEMIFGGVNGFNVFFPNIILKSSYIAPVFIIDFKIFNKSVIPGENSPLKKPIESTDSITLTYKDRVISFEFTSLHFSSPEKIQYAYFLEGFEESWNYCQNRKFATYTNLPAGDYTFRVKATNCDGLWNEAGDHINIEIIPPFWQTWWFRTLGLLLLIGMIILLYRVKLRRAIRNMEYKSRIEYFCKKSGLSDRECEVLELLIEGKNNKEIEDILFISQNTVRNHIYNIYKKLNINSRVHLLKMFETDYNQTTKEP